MKKLFLIAAFLLIANQGFALLSPLNQSLTEMQYIILSKELQKFLPQGEAVVEIRKIDTGYIVKTENNEMLVDVEYLPETKPGAKKFKATFHPATPIIHKYS